MTLQVLSHAATADRAAFEALFCSAPRAVRTGALLAGAPSDDYWRRFFVPTAASDLFVAVDGDRLLGRIGVHASPTRAGVGYVGWFECVEAPEGAHVAHALMDAACTVLRARGVTTAYGPIDSSTWHTYRYADGEILGPDGYQDAPFAWEPPDAPHYLRAFHAAGFVESVRYRTQAMRSRVAASTVEQALALTKRAYDGALAAGLTFRPFAPRERFEEELRPFYDVGMVGFREAFLFEPISFDECCALYAPAGARLAYEGLSHFVLDKEGREAGFTFAFRDRDYVVFKTLGVDPRLRARGLAYALMHTSFLGAHAVGIPHGISALVRSGNAQMDAVEATYLQDADSWRREYVLLEKAL